jgi:hypothetical protein
MESGPSLPQINLANREDSTFTLARRFEQFATIAVYIVALISIGIASAFALRALLLISFITAP